MAERHSGATTKGFLSDNQVHELKLGSSFEKRAYSSFHTIRYDFKPASVDVTKEAKLEVLKGNEISVTVPHIEGSGTNFTMFKGPKKPVQKECLLIIDNKTGEITLEKLSSTIHLKKQRLEGSSRATATRPLTPVEHHNKQSKSSSQSPPGNNQSSARKKEPQMPTFTQDIDRDLSPMSQPMVQPSHSPAQPSVQTVTHHMAPQPVMTAPVKTQPALVEDDLIMSSSDSSSSEDSSSDDGSSDESSSEDEQGRSAVADSHNNMRGNGQMMSGSNQSQHGHFSHHHHHHNSTQREPSRGGSGPYMSQLREDLHLSESGSDSD